MRVLTNTVLVLSSSLALCTAASWTFEDGQITVKSKGTGVDGGAKEKLSSSKPFTSHAISLSPADSLKLTLTTQEGSSGKKPHQAFLSLQDPQTGLEDAFPLSVKENGKAKLDISQKDIPQALLTKPKLKASIVIGSFGSSTGYHQHVFDLAPSFDTSSPAPNLEPPERLAKKAEIHHIFKQDPKSPPRIVSLVFTLAVLATLPVLLGAWVLLGANVDHASAAFSESPAAHGLFFGSILAMEGIFFMYYSSWNLFQTLPAAGVVGLVAYVSGSRALTEVQERRIAGKR